MPGRMVTPEPLQLVMPYFPTYTDNPVSTNVLDPSVSAILGGSNPILLPNEEWPRCGQCEDNILIPYIQINVSSPHTPLEFRQKVAVEAQPEHIVLLQVFICANYGCADCFEMRLVGAYDDVFLVRVIQVAPESVNTATVDKTRSQLNANTFFVRQRVISGWKPGDPEVPHEEVNPHLAYDDPQYLDHEPAHGLKLLGYPILGKYYTSTLENRLVDVRPQAGSTESSRHHDIQCLLQLGTETPAWTEGEHEEEWDEESFWTVGNTWVEQCAVHPDELSMAIGGTW